MNKRRAKNGLLALAALVLLFSCAAELYYNSGRSGTVPAEDDPDRPLHGKLLFHARSKGTDLPGTIRCVSGDDDMYYVYLPSYAGLDQTRVSLLTSVPLYLDGTRLVEGMSCEGFPLSRPLELTGDGLGALKIMFLPSANVATMYIDTATGSMDAIHKDKSLREEVSIVILDADGRCEYRTLGIDEIRGRGQSSWRGVKKGYNLYLDYSVDLFSMGKAKNWALIPDLVDESHLRNWLVYTFAAKVAPYPGFAPEFKFVELYLNGCYNGLYLLCEKAEIHPSRLDIDKGSWLFDFDQAKRQSTMSNAFRFGTGIAVEIKTPSVCTDEQRHTLKERLNAFQDALLSDSGIDPDTGKAWSDYIDLDSFARKYLVEEIFQNYDAGAGSQYYFWNSADDRIYAGPCWDYDLTLGISNQKNPSCFLARREWKTPSIYTPWFHGLWQHEEFREHVIELYRTEFQPALRNMMANDLPLMAETLDMPVARDRLRWISKYDSSKYTGSYDFLVEFLKERADFLDSAWIDGVDYRTITFNLNKGQYQFFCLPAGSTCESVPSPGDYGLEGDLCWLMEDGSAFDPDAVLTEDILLTAPPITNEAD